MRPDADPALASCSIQRAQCTEFIRSMAWRGWYPLAERFDDEGYSGANFERPGLQKLVDHIEQGRVGRVIVYRLDRLTRRLSDWALLARLFERFDVGLTVVEGAIDAQAGSLARLQMNALATFAELERDMIAERLADARAARKARGERSAGRVPLGYSTDPRTKQLVIVETEAATVRWFFDKAADGAAPRDLATSANELGLADKSGKKRGWSARSVLRLLRNNTYTGCRPDGAPGLHKAIINPELYQRVQAAVEGRRSRQASPRVLFAPGHDPFILRGLLRCTKCGKTMTTSMSTRLTRQSAKRAPRYYRCRTVGCRAQVRAAAAESAAFDMLRRAVPNLPAPQRLKLHPVVDGWDSLFPVNRRLVLAATFEFITCTPRGAKLVGTLRVDGLDLCEHQQ